MRRTTLASLDERLYTGVTMIRRVTITLFLAGACLAEDLARMEQVVQSYVSEKKFMGSVLVAREDEVLLSKGYGSANLEWNIPFKAEGHSILRDFMPAQEFGCSDWGRCGSGHMFFSSSWAFRGPFF
jgi:hypothetical protein